MFLYLIKFSFYLVKLKLKHPSAANKDQSTVNYHRSSVFYRPYLSCNDHYDQWLFQEILFFLIFLLEIFLNDFELVFLEIKHTYKTKRVSLFSLFLFFFYLLFRNHSVY